VKLGARAWQVYERVYPAITYVALAIMAAVVIVALSGCASMWSSVKSSAAPAGGAAGGAAVGLSVPPFGPIVGAALGAMITHAVAENASLRSGETVGKEALEEEIDRWKGEARAASSQTDWFKRLLMWSCAGLLAAFFLRNRHNFGNLGFWNGLLHSVFGGKFGRKDG